MQSYMLLNCNPGSEADVIAEVTSITGVIEVNGIMGKYDVLVKISGENPDAIEMTVANIRRIRIANSHTLPVIYGQGGTIDKELDNT